jgi:hypothetical protein
MLVGSTFYITQRYGAQKPQIKFFISFFHNKQYAYAIDTEEN